MPSQKIEKILETEFPTYTVSDKEANVVSSTFFKFRQSANDRNRNFQYFDGLNLIDYIDDSVRRFTTNVDERNDIEDWQARVHDPFTRNKVLAFLGKIVSVLPIAEFTGRGDEDYRKGTILTNLYEYFEDIEDYEELMINVLLESIVKGTAIGYEGIEKKTRKIRNIKNLDEDISETEESETVTRLTGSLVPLEDFYPSSVGIRTIKKMPYCFWRSTVNYSVFLAAFSSYEKSKYVQPKTTFQGDKDEKRPFYMDYTSEDVTDGNVEIIRYYNREVDEYIIIANGIWLNPKTTKAGVEIISPIPFNHKELPFWEIKFDLFGDFFYGKSLPDRLKSLQDVLNVLTNMLLDQSFLTIFPPLLTNGFDPIEDDYLRPGRRTPIDTQGLPISQSFMKLDVGTPGGWHQFILDYTKKIMEQSSMDQVSSGQAGVGGRTTASEIRTAADGVASLLGIFARLVNYGIKRKAILKAGNIIQSISDPKNPILKKVGGESGEEDFKKAFNTFKIQNAVLTHGKRGTKIIEIYSDKSAMPTGIQLRAKSAVEKVDSGRDIEFMAVSAEYLRDFQYDCKLNLNPKTQTSKDLEKAIQLEKVKTYLSFFPNIVNVNELAAETAEKMGDDPTKILNDAVFNPPQENPNKLSPEGMNPQGNTAQNMVRGANGGEMAANEMQGLIGDITG